MTCRREAQEASTIQANPQPKLNISSESKGCTLNNARLPEAREADISKGVGEVKPGIGRALH